MSAPVTPGTAAERRTDRFTIPAGAERSTHNTRCRCQGQVRCSRGHHRRAHGAGVDHNVRSGAVHERARACHRRTHRGRDVAPVDGRRRILADHGAAQLPAAPIANRYGLPADQPRHRVVVFRSGGGALGDHPSTARQMVPLADLPAWSVDSVRELRVATEGFDRSLVSWVV
jgi:hypothetical protein